MILVNAWLLRMITGKFAIAMSLWPFIIVRDAKCKSNVLLIRHERIHLRQQAELFVLLFYIWYGLEFLFHLTLIKNKTAAYHRICFEREAYQNECQADYLENRKPYAFISYLRLKKK